MWDLSKSEHSCPQPPNQSQTWIQIVFLIVHTPYYLYERLK